MTLKEIIDLIRQDSGSYLVVFFVISGLIEFIPIKVNPLSYLFGRLSDLFNKNLNTKLDDINNKLNAHIELSKERNNKIEKKIDDHIVSSDRAMILDFENSCVNGRKHTKEEFDFIIGKCDYYEDYCNQNNIPNGVAEIAISDIKRRYLKCLKEGTFLKEEVIYENEA